MPRLATARRIGVPAISVIEEAALAAFERRTELHRGADGRLRTPDALAARRADFRVQAGARRVESRFEHRGRSDRLRAVRIRRGDERHHLRIDELPQAAFRGVAETTRSSRNTVSPKNTTSTTNTDSRSRRLREGRDKRAP